MEGENKMEEDRKNIRDCIKYFVDPEAKVVIAKADWYDVTDIIRNEVNAMFNTSLPFFWIVCDRIVPYTKTFAEKKGLVAKAYCHPNDTFDENIGKIVARRRLQKMYLKIASHVFDRVNDRVVDLSKTLMSRSIKYGKSAKMTDVRKNVAE